MRAFLIDFENVKSAGLTGIEELSGEDRVIILYSVNSNTISFEMHQKIISCRAAVDYFQIRRGGKNSLDFQLSTLLGWMLASNSYSHLYIISNDSGFDALYDFWTSGYVPTECVVYRRATLAQADSHSKSYRRPAAALPQEEIPLPEVDIDEPLLPEEPDSPDIINIIDLFQKSSHPAAGRPEEELSHIPFQDDDEGLSLEALLASSPIAAAEAPSDQSQTDQLETGQAQPEQLQSEQTQSEQAQPEQAQPEQTQPDQPQPKQSKSGRSKSAQQKAAQQKSEPRETSEELDMRVHRVAEALPASLHEIVNEENLLRIAGDVVSSPGKQDFYRDIIRRYGQKKGLQVYKTVRSEYSSLKKLADS